MLSKKEQLHALLDGSFDKWMPDPDNEASQLHQHVLNFVDKWENEETLDMLIEHKHLRDFFMSAFYRGGAEAVWMFRKKFNL
jgi:hypothetical protein